MDSRMQRKDAYAAAKAIQVLDRAGAKTVPIFGMTADAFNDDVKRCLETGMDAHLTKTIEPMILYYTRSKFFETHPEKMKWRLLPMNKAEKNEEMIGRLTEWGCDIVGALPRFINDKNFYCRLLVSIPEQDDFIGLGNALAAGNAGEAFEHAHALKGVLSNMGLTPMYEESCAIVEPLRVGSLENIDAHYKKLMGQRDTLIRILGNAD